MGRDVATIKAVIFDLDGTLLDTESLSCRAVIETFALIGLTIPSEIYASLNAIVAVGTKMPDTRLTWIRLVLY